MTWARPVPDGVDPRPRAHPDVIAEDRAHTAARHAGTCPAWNTRQGGKHCTCTLDPADVAAVWAGRRRMAAARLDAGVQLDDLDRQALDR